MDGNLHGTIKIIPNDGGKPKLVDCDHSIICALSLTEGSGVLASPISISLATRPLHGQLEAIAISSPEVGFYKKVPDASSADLPQNLVKACSSKSAYKVANDAIGFLGAFDDTKSIASRVEKDAGTFSQSFAQPRNPENEANSIRDLLKSVDGSLRECRHPEKRELHDLRTDAASILGALNDSARPPDNEVTRLSESVPLKDILPKTDVGCQLPASIVLWSAYQSIGGEKHIPGINPEEAKQAICSLLTASATSGPSGLLQVRKGLIIAEQSLRGMWEKSSDGIKKEKLLLEIDNVATARDWIRAPDNQIQLGLKALDVLGLERDRMVAAREILGLEYAAGNSVIDITRPERGRPAVCLKFDHGDEFTCAEGGIMFMKNANGRLEVVDKPGEDRKYLVDGAKVTEARANFSLFRQANSFAPDPRADASAGMRM